MQFGLKLLVFSVVGLLIAACAPAVQVTPTVEAPIDQAQDDSPGTAAMVDGATARPRFLDAYADW